MKKMKTTIAASVALAAFVSMPVFAQLSKENTITFALTGASQTSVSTSATLANAGDWSQGPEYYKTTTFKVTDKNIIQYIAYILYGNPNHYSTTAKLVLDQSELSGFFNITPDLAHSDTDVGGPSALGTSPQGTFLTSPDLDSSTALANSSDSTAVVLDSGEHIVVNPLTGLNPVGHLQPWGQIWVKDSARGEYDNVTYFFALSVQECYDCFYLNSFISQSTFKTKVGGQVGPPCCTTPSALVGTGKDSYYLTLSFDNTVNNPYLNPDTAVGGTSVYVGVVGANANPATATIPGDGIAKYTLDDVNYIDAIRAGVGRPEPYVARFTLNGILTYTWTLKYINTTDIAPDFVGTGVYPVSGYGFIGLFCSLLSGTGDFTEKLVKTSTTLQSLAAADVSWQDSWYGIGAEYVSTVAPAYDTAYDLGLADNITPINVGTSLTYHENFDIVYPTDVPDFAPAAWPTPSEVDYLGW
jgi:hypothetical protein